MRYKRKSIVASFVLHDETTSCCFYILFTAVFGIGERKFKVTGFWGFFLLGFLGLSFCLFVFCWVFFFYFSLLIPLSAIY